MTTTHNAAFSATKILLPIDFSASSEGAVEAGTGLARQFRASVPLVHIIAEIPDFLDRSADELAEQGEKAEQRYDVTHSIFMK